MNAQQHRRFDDFSWAAACVLYASILLVLLSTATRFAVDNPWPQLLFLELFAGKQMQLLAVVLTPSPLFSPFIDVLLFSIMPLFFHLYALILLWRVVAHWELKARLVYTLVAAIPIFGPIATRTIMKSFGEFKE